MRVAVVLKKDQPTGILTEGTVKRILTSSPSHHRGIKVMLEENDMVGRVQKILDEKNSSLEYAGSVEIGKNKARIFTGDWENFFADMAGLGKMPVSEVRCWALYHNSPCTDENVGYHLRLIHKEDACPPRWRCTFYTRGYDCVYASIAGYGESPEEAMRNTKSRLRLLQQRFNPENRKI